MFPTPHRIPLSRKSIIEKYKYELTFGKSLISTTKFHWFFHDSTKKLFSIHNIRPMVEKPDKITDVPQQTRL